MKFKSVQSLKEIANFLNCDYIGDDDFQVFGMNEIHVVEAGDIVFVDHPKYYDKALNSNATVILINKKVPCPEGKALLITDDPFRDFNALTTHFNPFISSQAAVSKTASIGENTIIQPNVFIGENVQIGSNCVIHSNVVINNNCIIGDNVVIQSATVLGTDAFYYKRREEGYDRLLSGGRVVIENDVELGGLCTIDRGVTGDTKIKKGCKIDNQVHVGHDTLIGENCLIASQTGIAGCVVIEDEVILWGQVGVTSGIKIGKGAIVLAQAGVTKTIAGGKTYSGTPITESRQKLKEIAGLRKLLKDQ